MKLKLSEWANIAEITASFVIVLSLAYVGLELNQNTTALQLTSYQDTLDKLTSLDLAVAQSSELHKIVSVGKENPDILTDEEWSRFTHFIYPRLGIWEYLFLSRGQGGVSNSQWVAFEPYFVRLSCTPGYIRFFEENEESYAGDFGEYLDGQVLANC